MSEDIEEIRKELEEIRRLKESMRHELESLRRERESVSRHLVSKPPKAMRPPRLRASKIDLTPLTESLEDMMEDLGEQIEQSLGALAGLDTDIRVPHLRVKKGRKKRRKRDIEEIPPERVADVISPLGSVERLKILEYLKDGSKSFNELENYIGKTGSSLTHHLNPLLDAGYVIKGEVRGTYYVTVEGSLAYRLAQWLTSQLEHERKLNGAKKRKTAAVSTTADSQEDGEQEVKVTIETDDEEDDLE